MFLTSDNMRRRVAELPKNDRGNVMLLSGMMMFLVMIMAVWVMDTNKAVYNRIIAQNAVDAAAETAALMQARGLNLQQHINNIHYTANKIMFYAEEGALVVCALEPAGCIATHAICDDPFTAIGCPIAVGAFNLSCGVCASAGPINVFHDWMYTGIQWIQSFISKYFPAAEFCYANQVAKQSGADPILEVAPEYAASLAKRVEGGLEALGIPIPKAINESALSGFQTFIASVVPNLPVVNEICALPLSFDSLSLHTIPVDGTGLPWKWPDGLRLAAPIQWNLGRGACKGCVPFSYNPFTFIPNIPAPDNDKWGWADQYYAGHPGFMTWIAGTKEHKELAGLGKIVWLNSPGKASNTDQLAMFDTAKSITGGEPPDWIPAFVAVASCQVEGTPVVDHCSDEEVNSTPKLIKVYFPPKMAGENLLILH